MNAYAFEFPENDSDENSVSQDSEDGSIYIEFEDNLDGNPSEDESPSHNDDCDISFIQDEGSNDSILPTSLDNQQSSENAVSENPGKILKPLTCEICNTSFRTREQIDNHYEEHDTVTCKQCEICFNILDLKLHEDHLGIHKKAYDYRINRKYKKVQCKICSKYVSRNYINTHTNLHEKDEERFSECQICNKKIITSYLIQHYKRIHKKDAPNIISQRCPICEKFYKMTKYKEHLASHHQTLKKYVCDKCGKEFNYASAFKTHVLTHTGELKYKCEFCDYHGLHKALLKIHLRTHTKDYAYKCSNCEKKFITKSNLNIHERIHDKRKKFTCSECNKSFHTEKRMMKHFNLIHLNIRDHQCEICGKAFGDKDGLYSHQKKIHKCRNLLNKVGKKPTYLLKKCHNND